MSVIQSLFAVCCLASALYPAPTMNLVQSGETLDQEVVLRIEGLTPNEVIELDAQALDPKGETWISHAVFKADTKGSVDLRRDAPLSNSSYETADPTGLFWSMHPLKSDPLASFKCKDDQFTVEFTLLRNGHPKETKTITLFLKKPDIERTEIRENGVAAVLFTPPSEKPLPVVITLSGSNGGFSENRAKLLASHGFAVLALGYFGAEGLPANLQDIPLEYFEQAFNWLKTQPKIDGSRIGLYGISRGGELALLLGSTFPHSIQAITAIVPSSVVFGGLSETPVNAWTYGGKPVLPAAPVAQIDLSNGKGASVENPANTRQNFIEGMKQSDAYAAASIPVEKIRCPILIVSGGDDQMWPSDLFCEQILNRLKNTSIPCTHLHYPNAGHGINIPNLPIPGPTYYHPVGKIWLSTGGSQAADAAASQDAWNQLVAFFEKSLQEKEPMNSQKFSLLKPLNLPMGEYAIIGSGPIGIRNIRAINDIDLIVTPSLWRELAEKYGVTDTGKVKKIVFPGGMIEAFWEESFYSESYDPNAPLMSERISQAEIIEGLPFDSLENTLYYKRKQGREKDLKDILLIEQYLKQ